MTKTQMVALRRILDRETADYQVRSERPAPGQHRTEDKVAISDGRICVLLDALLPEFPVGERVDTFAKIVRNERECGGHLPIAEEQIRLSHWKAQAKAQAAQAGDILGIELSVPKSATQLSIDPLAPGQAVSIDHTNPIVAQFDPRLLIDATEAIGGKPLYFLGFGRFNAHYPSLFVVPPKWTENGAEEPVALILPIRP